MIKTDIISGFRCKVYENSVLLGYYATSSGNSIPTFRDNLSVPSSRVNPWRWDRQVVPNLRQEIATIPCLTSRKIANLVTKVLGYKTWNFNGKNKFLKTKLIVSDQLYSRCWWSNCNTFKPQPVFRVEAEELTEEINRQIKIYSWNPWGSLILHAFIIILYGSDYFWRSQWSAVRQANTM
jgi:hypothetical protein